MAGTTDLNETAVMSVNESDKNENQATEASIENQFDLLKSEYSERTAFVDLNGTGYENTPQNELFEQLEKDNPRDLTPFAAVKRFKTIRLVLHSKDQRDRVIKDGYKLGHVILKPELPHAVAKAMMEASERLHFTRKVLYFFGIPMHFSDEFFVSFLKEKGLEPVNEPRWLRYKNSTIRTGGRSILLKIPNTFEVPDHVRLDIGGKVYNVQIWYPGIPQKCRNCGLPGHKRDSCPQRESRRRDPVAKSPDLEFQDAIEVIPDTSSRKRAFDPTTPPQAPKRPAVDDSMVPDSWEDLVDDMGIDEESPIPCPALESDEHLDALFREESQ